MTTAAGANDAAVIPLFPKMDPMDNMDIWETELQAFRTWYRAAGLARSTADLRVYYLRRFSELVPEPWQATLDDMAAFLANEAWCPDTRKSARSALRAFYSWGLETDRIVRDASAKLPRVRVPSRRARPTPEAVLATALETANDRDRLMLMLGAFAGLRRAEIAAQALAAIRSLDDLRIIGKGDRERFVPIHERLRVELVAELERRNEGRFGTGYRYGVPRSPWLFPGQSGGHVTADCVGRTLARRLGGEYSAHTLRHRFATRAYNGTKDLRAVQELLGHSRPETTSRYVAVSNDSLRAAVDAA